MQRNASASPGRPRVVYDMNGVAMDDVTPCVERRFPAQGHGAVRRAYVEVLYNLLRPFKRTMAKRLDGAQISREAAESMRNAQAHGSSVGVCTSNPILYSSKLARLLEDAGVHGVAAKLSYGRSKADVLWSDTRLMIEDDSIDALRIARSGREVALFSRDYNAILGLIFSRINHNLYPVRNWMESNDAILRATKTPRELRRPSRDTQPY